MRAQIQYQSIITYKKTKLTNKKMAKLNQNQIKELVSSNKVGEKAANNIANLVRKIAKNAPIDQGDELNAFNDYFIKVKQIASSHISDVLNSNSLTKRMFVQALSSFDNYDVHQYTTGEELDKAVFDAELILSESLTVNEFDFVTDQMFNEDLRIKGISFP